MFFIILLFFLNLSANEIATSPAVGNYENEIYVNFRKINNITLTYEANGGEHSQYPLSNAFDGRTGSYWVSNTPNSDSFTNDLTISFNEFITLEAFLYDPAYTTNPATTPPTRTYYGYPTKLNVYALSLSNISEKVVTFSGNHEYPTTRVQFVFPTPVTCKELRLEFVEVTHQSMPNVNDGPNPVIDNLIFLRYIPIIKQSEAASGNYIDQNYVNLRKILNTKFKAEANGCSYEWYYFFKAFDDNSVTYWTSDTPNSDSFTNIILISFKELTTLEAFLYNPAYSTNRSIVPPIREFWGYPTKLNVYALSLTNRYELVATFTGNHEYPTTLVQFVFPTPVTCKKLKLEFAEVTNQSMTSGKGPNPMIRYLVFLRYIPIVQTVDPEGKFLDNDYISENHISKDAFKLIANGGESSLFPLSNAIDGLSSSYWVSNLENSDNFINKLTFEFNETFLIEGFLYDALYNTNNFTNDESHELWGYPITLNVYSANKNTKIQLSAVFVGNHFYPSTRIQFSFPIPIYCTKMILEFIDITPQFLEGNSLKVIVCDLILIKKDYKIPISIPSGNYSYTDYISEHRIPQDSFLVTSNGGEYNENRKLEYGFDNDINTYHLSGIPNSANFFNTFTIDFLEIQTLDAFLYFPTYISDENMERRFEGFPTTLEIYTSLDDDDNFDLVAIFAGMPVYPMSWIQYAFQDPITCTKIQLRFVEVTDVIMTTLVSSPGKYASIGEISFIKSDENFTYNDDFVACEVFSISEVLTRSSCFSSSSTFSKSDGFSKSDFFTRSEGFSESDSFSKSDVFIKSEGFSESDSFSKSDIFSKSDFFTRSECFSESDTFSKSDVFTKSGDFSESNLLSSYSFTRSSEFTKSEYFTKSNEFTSSSIFSQSKSFSKEIQTNPAVFTSLSISYSISFVTIKSVSYSLSYLSSNTFMMSYLEEENTYSMIITQNYYISYFPYIIQYLSPVSITTFIRIIVRRKNNISPEQLIGVSCGSASIFFLILGIIILVLRKKNCNEDDISHDFSYESSSSEIINCKKVNDDTFQLSTNINDEKDINQKSDSNDDMNFWL